MESIRTSKEILKEWVEAHMTPHTDWTGTRIETKYKCESLEEFVDKLYEYLSVNHYRV
jgi:hypothetical protein